MEAIEMNGIEMGRKAGYSPLDRDEIAYSHTIRVTNSAWENLATLGAKYGMSRSAFIDAIGRGVLGDSGAELTTPTISGNLIEDESIAPHLQPPPPTNTNTNTNI